MCPEVIYTHVVVVGLLRYSFKSSGSSLGLESFSSGRMVDRLRCNKMQSKQKNYLFLSDPIVPN